MDNGNLGINLVYTYAGNPTNVSTQAFNPPQGSIVIDTITQAVWQKTSLTDNSGYSGVAGSTSGAITPTTVAATGAISSTSSIKSSSATAGIGYATGSGGAVTQITSRSTGVTLSKVSGTIQTDTSSLAAGAAAQFTVTNPTVAIGDVVVLSIRSGTTTTQTMAYVNTVAAGSFAITINNGHATTAEVGAIIINFCVIKAVSA